MGLENMNNQSNRSDQIFISDFIKKIRIWMKYLFFKWKVIALFGLFGAALGFTYAKFKKTFYIAQSTFVLEEGDSHGGLAQYAGLASMAGINVGGGDGIFQGDNIFELYKSRTMIEKTLLTEIVNKDKKELLIDTYINLNNIRDGWKNDPKLKDIKFNVRNPLNENLTRLQDSLMGVFVGSINNNYLTVAKLDKRLSIIKVEVKATDEFFAKKFNQVIVKNVNDFYIQTKTKKSLDNIQVLKGKTDSVRSVMNGAIYGAAEVSDATPNLNPTRQLQRVVPIQRSQFTAEMNKAILIELTRNLELTKLTLLNERPLIQMIDGPVLPLYKEKLGKVRGIIFGGIAGAFFCVVLLLLRKTIASFV
ncbi:lipopolysaccharide biosynthesis protein [Pedobacter nutrimenti]|uniref:lipopolysaccharide biosynthesis protein n=1 Tax=Pedobacter nutrimenti TaxID=1241337 RepID=UPI00292FAEEF|nr:lipopolysaccharide biosynthesis protein [Pedobacter nutrimenti]